MLVWLCVCVGGGQADACLIAKIHDFLYQQICMYKTKGNITHHVPVLINKQSQECVLYIYIYIAPVRIKHNQ